MLHHLSLPVRNIKQSAALYDAALGALGYVRVVDHDDFVGYGTEPGEDKLALRQTDDAGAASAGFHIALAANSRQAVAEFHAAALAHGAQDNGQPGLRAHYGPDYYAAFVIDLDGHRLEAVYKGSV